MNPTTSEGINKSTADELLEDIEKDMLPYVIGSIEKHQPEEKKNRTRVSSSTQLGVGRRKHIELFSKPSKMKDVHREWDSIQHLHPTSQRTSIHIRGKDGDHSVFEVDYDGSSVFSNHVEEKCDGFIDGNFSQGKIKDIETRTDAFHIKFNLDSSILAVGLLDGVELYETRQFRLIHTIDGLDTVSAIDWAEGSNKDNVKIGVKEQLLAVGCFDGSVKIYNISMAPSRELVSLVDSFRVTSDVCSMAFVQDSGSYYAPKPLAIVIGEKSGNLSLVNISFDNQMKSADRIHLLTKDDSGILAVTFGFSERDGVMLVYGTKSGRVVAWAMSNKGNQWMLSYTISQIERAGSIRALRFNHDSSNLVVGGYDKSVLIIDTSRWKVLREIPIDGTVQTIEFDPYNRYLLLGNRSKMMTVVDTSTLHPIKTFHMNGWVTSISWGGHSLIALRSDERVVSLILFEPVNGLDKSLSTSKGENTFISWSSFGRFLARTLNHDVIISDSKKNFQDIAKLSDVAKLSENDVVRCIKFCETPGMQDKLAIVSLDGYLRIVSLRVSLGKIHQELIASVFVERNLRTVAWAPDGRSLVVGGRGMNLHHLNTTNFQLMCEPIPISGRIWMVDSLSPLALTNVGEHASSFGLAVTYGKNTATVFDLNSNQIALEITRPRTVRCLKYHPTLPVLAIGDGSNEVIILDLVGERKLASFFVQGRVNAIAFSTLGDYIAVGSDACFCTIHDTTTFRCIQEIQTKSKIMGVEFSGYGCQFLAINLAEGSVQIIKLGPLLSIDHTPLNRILDLPYWAAQEIIYRSPEGPSYLQRCILDGSKQSIICAESVLRQCPESVLTFNRTTGVGCFETAVELRNPNIMRLIISPVMDGTLDTSSAWSSSLLTTSMPVDAYLTLRDLIINHPPGFATDTIRKMTFVKVPFAKPRICLIDEVKECGSPNFTDPWGNEKVDLYSRNRQNSRTSFKSSKQKQKQNKNEITLIPAVLPLPGLGTLDFLSALITNTGADVFDNDAMGLVLLVLWNSGISNYFMVDFVLNSIFFILWIIFLDFSASTTISSSEIDTTTLGLAWAIVGLNTIFVGEQVLRFMTRMDNFVRSGWRYIETVSIMLVYLYTMLVVYGKEGYVALAVFTTIGLTAKFISFLRGFERTGWLVAVLTQNFLDVRGFLIIMVIILLGFTAQFRILFSPVHGQCQTVIGNGNQIINECDGEPFGTMARSILSTFEITILGAYDSDILYENENHILAGFVFMIAVTVIFVISLNALIAVLGDSFSRVQENVTANRRRERAELIVDYLSMMPNRTRKRIEEKNQYFHALLASDGHGDLLFNRDDWQGGFNHMLKKDLADISEASNVFTQQAIEDLRAELTEEIRSLLNSEVTSVLNNVFLELKDLSNYRKTSLRTKKVNQAVQNLGQGHGRNNYIHHDGIRRIHTPDSTSIQDDKEF